jgi:hypothetical protein
LQLKVHAPLVQVTLALARPAPGQELLHEPQCVGTCVAAGQSDSAHPARSGKSQLALHVGVIALHVEKRPPTHARAPVQVPASFPFEHGCGTA